MPQVSLLIGSKSVATVAEIEGDLKISTYSFARCHSLSGVGVKGKGQGVKGKCSLSIDSIESLANSVSGESGISIDN